MASTSRFTKKNLTVCSLFIIARMIDIEILIGVNRNYSSSLTGKPWKSGH